MLIWWMKNWPNNSNRIRNLINIIDFCLNSHLFFFFYKRLNCQMLHLRSRKTFDLTRRMTRSLVIFMYFWVIVHCLLFLVFWTCLYFLCLALTSSCLYKTHFTSLLDLSLPPSLCWFLASLLYLLPSFFFFS